MFKKLIRGSKFIKKMNTLMELYSYSHNTNSTYQELLKLHPLVRTKGEESLYELNCAALLYDMGRYKESADILRDIQPLNPEFDAQCAAVKTKVMDAWQGGLEF